MHDDAGNERPRCGVINRVVRRIRVMARASQVDDVLQKVTTVADRVLRAGGSLSFHHSGVSLG